MQQITQQLIQQTDDYEKDVDEIQSQKFQGLNSIINSFKQYIRNDDQTEQKKNKNYELSKIKQENGELKIKEQFILDLNNIQDTQTADQSQNEISQEIVEQNYVFCCQEIIINQQLFENVQIQYEKLQIKNKIVKKDILTSILGFQNESLECSEFQHDEKESISNDFNLNHQINSNQQQTIQKIYQNKSGNYNVSVKTNVSKDNKKFIILKTLEKDPKMTSEQFRDYVKMEIDVLNHIQKQNTKVSLRFIKYEFQKDEHQNEKCVMFIESGLKSLDLIQKQYQINQNYQNYNMILEFGFCQLLQKLNQLHNICKIAHSDIKPQNIVIGYDLNFYFIDFGGSVFLDREESYQQYLQFQTPIYNLNVFLEKGKNQNWQISEIILCDYTQLIITFLNLIDVDKKYFADLKMFDLSKSEDFKNHIKPEFKKLGNCLVDCLSYIYQILLGCIIKPPQQEIFLISDFGGHFKEVMNNLHDIVYNKEKQQYEVIQINKFSIQIIELILSQNQGSKIFINEITQVDPCINQNKQQTNENDVSQYPHFCKYFQLKQKNILFLGFTDYKFNNKPNLIQQYLYQYNQKTPIIQLQDYVPKYLIEQFDVASIHIFFKFYSMKLQKSLMGFEMIKHIDMLQIFIDSFDGDSISNILFSLKIKAKKLNKLEKIIISFSENQYQLFQDQIPKLNKKCKKTNKSLFIQIFVSNIDNLSNYLTLSNSDLYFAINIQNQTHQLSELIEVLKQEINLNENTLLIAKGIENQNEHLIKQKSFKITKIFNKYYSFQKIENKSESNKDLDFLKQIIINFLNGTNTNIFQQTIQTYHPFNDLQNQDPDQLFSNLLQNRNQLKSSYMFLISFCQKIYEMKIQYSPNLFQNLQIVESDKYSETNATSKKKIQLKVFSQYQQKLMKDFELQNLINQIYSKVTNKPQKESVDLIFQNNNFDHNLDLIQNLEEKFKEIKFKNLKIKLVDSVFNFDTFLDFIKCFEFERNGKIQLYFSQIEFNSLLNIQILLDYFYQNNLLFTIKIQNSKLKLRQLNDINQFSFNFSEQLNVQATFQNSQIDLNNFHLKINQKFKKQLEISNAQYFGYLTYYQNQYYIQNEPKIIQFIYQQHLMKSVCFLFLILIVTQCVLLEITLEIFEQYEIIYEVEKILLVELAFFMQQIFTSPPFNDSNLKDIEFAGLISITRGFIMAESKEDFNFQILFCASIVGLIKSYYSFKLNYLKVILKDENSSISSITFCRDWQLMIQFISLVYSLFQLISSFYLYYNSQDDILLLDEYSILFFISNIIYILIFIKFQNYSEDFISNNFKSSIFQQ